MGDAGFFRGTSSEQDARFSDKMKKLVRNSKFPKNFFKKVNLKKVQLSVFRPWITRRITELLGVEDDIVIEFALSILDQEASQIHLTGFLEKNAPIFMQELWDLLLDAQENPTGIPTKFIEEKKEELRRKKIEEEKIRKRLERERLQESKAREEARLLRQKEREKNPNNGDADIAPPKESSKRSSDRRSPSPSHNRHSDRHHSSHRSRSRERSSRREHRESSDRDRDYYRSEHRRRDTHSRRSETGDREEHSSRHGREREKDSSSRGGNSHSKEHDSKYIGSKKNSDTTNLDDPSLIYDDIQDIPLDYDRSSKRHHR